MSLCHTPFVLKYSILRAKHLSSLRAAPRSLPLNVSSHISIQLYVVVPSAHKHVLSILHLLSQAGRVVLYVLAQTCSAISLPTAALLLLA